MSSIPNASAKASLGQCAFFALLFLAILPLTAADIHSWRPENNASYPAARPPLQWEDEILYKTPLQGTSNGTPILVKGRLIFTSEPANLVCLDRATGEILWSRSNDLIDIIELSDSERAQIESQKAVIATHEKSLLKLKSETRRLSRAVGKNPDNEVAKKGLKTKNKASKDLEKKISELKRNPLLKDAIRPPAHNTNGYSSYTPLSDGQHIYACFGLGLVVAYDLEGNRLWAKKLEAPDHRWGGATMPRLVDGKLIVRFSNYTALNPKNGDILWTSPSSIVFGTPTPFQVEGQHFLFTPRGEIIQVSDGKRIQKGLVFLHETRDWSVYNTPTLVDGTLYAVSGVEKANGDAYAFKVPETLDILRKKGLKKVWHTQVSQNRYYASPLIHDGMMYIITRENVLTALNAASGKIVYTKKITGVKGQAYPSLTAAGGNIFISIDDGNLIAMKPGSEYKEISRNHLDAFRSTPIFSEGAAYLRTFDSLLAVGSSDS